MTHARKSRGKANSSEVIAHFVHLSVRSADGKAQNPVLLRNRLLRLCGAVENPLPPLFHLRP